MQTYVKEHFARMREEWAINCIAPTAWRNKEHLEIQTNDSRKFNIKHRNSRVQQYSHSGENRQQPINSKGSITSAHEIRQAITKLGNRKSVGYDELTAEIFKINSEWLVPIIRSINV